MQIKHEDILITQKNPSLITQKELQEDNELIRRFIESSLSTLEMKFGMFTKIEIRRDIEEGLTANHIKEFGGNKIEPIFVHVVNANSSKKMSDNNIKNYKITMMISVQEEEKACDEIGFIDKIKNIFGVK